MWVDFRGIRDELMREHGSDYFEHHLLGQTISPNGGMIV
jgi:hypothetical protein